MRRAGYICILQIVWQNGLLPKQCNFTCTVRMTASTVITAVASVMSAAMLNTTTDLERAKRLPLHSPQDLSKSISYCNYLQAHLRQSFSIK